MPTNISTHGKTGVAASTPSSIAEVDAERRIRLLAIIEATSMTGPAKNLLDFCRLSRHLPAGPPIDTSILTFQRVGLGRSVLKPTNEFMEEALRHGVPVQAIPERFAYDPRVLGDLISRIDSIGPDIIQTHAIKSHFLVRCCGLHKRRVWVAFHHGYTKTTYRRELLKYLDRWSLQAATQVMTVSQAFADQLCAVGISRKRVKVLHNAIDCNWLSSGKGKGEPSQRPILSSGRRLVLAVGRLSKEKRFVDLVAAIQHLNKMQGENTVQLVIVGDGPQKHTLGQAIRKARLEHQIQLVGHVADVKLFYEMADVLVISSASEGSPNALLEAMVAGVPVVATSVGGIPEIVTDGETALLVPPYSPSVLARAINRVLSDHNLRQTLSLRARRLVETHYSPVFRAQVLSDLYKRLLDSRFNDKLLGFDSEVNSLASEAQP
jgi:glycosyltransferase involved in cell wall biosynthesis